MEAVKPARRADDPAADVRRAEPADLAALLALEKETWGTPATSHWDRANAIAYHHVWVAGGRTDNTIAGFAVAIPTRTWGVMLVDTLIVSTGARKLGLGSLLWDALYKDMPSPTEVRALVARDDRVAQDFWRSLGFERHRFAKAYEGVLGADPHDVLVLRP